MKEGLALAGAAENVTGTTVLFELADVAGYPNRSKYKDSPFPVADSSLRRDLDISLPPIAFWAFPMF